MAFIIFHNIAIYATLKIIGAATKTIRATTKIVRVMAKQIDVPRQKKFMIEVYCENV